MKSIEYTEDEMLPLSGIQHYAYCPRQWALIHIEQLWAENHLTMEGHFLHNNVDNPFLRESNGSNVLTLRCLRLSSPTIGLNGVSDAVELHPIGEGNVNKDDMLKSKSFKALPIEYKRGKRKINDCDRLQVTAQAMILEELLGVEITEGAIFYWQERHREYVEITTYLREKVITFSKEMHEISNKGITPPAVRDKWCRSCSLENICMPSICNKNVNKYLNSIFDETSS